MPTGHRFDHLTDMHTCYTLLLAIGQRVIGGSFACMLVPVVAR